MREAVNQRLQCEPQINADIRGWWAGPESEGSRIRGIPPESWEAVYRAYRRKNVSGRGSLLVRPDRERVELTFTPGASHLSERHICDDYWRRHTRELTTRNATPLRAELF